MQLLKTEIRNCEECSLRQFATTPVPGIGKRDYYRCVVIGQNPGRQEDLAGRPFVGPTGELLTEVLKDAGLKLTRDCYTTNAVKCLAPTAKITKKILRTCSEKFLVHELDMLNCEWVLLLGKHALQAVFPSDKISDRRGHVLTHPSYPEKKFFATFHPAAVLRDPGYEEFFVRDIYRFGELVENGLPDPIGTNYIISETNEQTHKILEFLTKQNMFSFDIETSGLDPFENDAYISMVAFSRKDGRGFVIPINHPEIAPISDKNLALLKELLENKHILKIAHNCTFDIKWIKQILGIEVRGMYWDTMYAAYVQDERRKMASLKNLAAEFTDLGDYKAELVAAVGNLEGAELFRSAPYQILARYAAKDADATFRLYNIFHDCHENSVRFMRHMAMLVDAAYSIVEMELTGWHIDMDVVKEVELTLKEKLEELLETIKNIDAVQRFTQSTGVEFNPRSNPQKVLVLTDYAGIPLSKRTAGGAFSTGKDILKQFPKSKLCSTLLEYSEVSKLQSTYSSKMFKKCSDDGRLRTSYNLALTGSGRLSSQSPNLQNLPSHGRYAPLVKRQFGCPAGFKIAQFDYNQIELRLMAVYSRDNTMLAAYINGEDLHKITASAVYGIPLEEVEKDQRSVAKTLNFFLIYGGTAKSLKERLFTMAGVKVSIAEATRIRQRFFEHYPSIIDYHKRVERFVMDHGYITTKFGNKRHLPAAQSMDDYERALAFNTAYNHPIQGTAAWIMLEALARIRPRHGDSYYLLGTVHDSAMVYIRDDENFHRHISGIKYAMEDMNYDWLTIPIPVEIEVGSSWGALEEYNV